MVPNIGISIQWKLDIKRSDIIPDITLYFSNPNELISFVLYCLLTTDILRMVTFGGGKHHGMFLSRGLKWYWGKIISPETKSRDLYSSRNIISKPQDTGNIPWCSRQQSRHLLYCMATHCPHCIARLRHSSQKFTKLSIFFSGDFL